MQIRTSYSNLVFAVSFCTYALMAFGYKIWLYIYIYIYIEHLFLFGEDASLTKFCSKSKRMFKFNRISCMTKEQRGNVYAAQGMPLATNNIVMLYVFSQQLFLRLTSCLIKQKMLTFNDIWIWFWIPPYNCVG